MYVFLSWLFYCVFFVFSVFLSFSLYGFSVFLSNCCFVCMGLVAWNKTIEWNGMDVEILTWNSQTHNGYRDNDETLTGSLFWDTLYSYMCLLPSRRSSAVNFPMCADCRTKAGCTMTLRVHVIVCMLNDYHSYHDSKSSSVESSTSANWMSPSGSAHNTRATRGWKISRFFSENIR